MRSKKCNFCTYENEIFHFALLYSEQSYNVMGSMGNGVMVESFLWILIRLIIAVLHF